MALIAAQLRRASVALIGARALPVPVRSAAVRLAVCNGGQQRFHAVIPQPLLDEETDAVTMARSVAAGKKKVVVEKPVDPNAAVRDEQVTFADLGLDTNLVERLSELGYSHPFGIQEKTLKSSLEDNDVIGKAVTGSGKTLAFVLPILQKLSSNPTTKKGRRKPRALILAPTRELALQTQRVLEKLEGAVNLKSVCVYGGASIQAQQRALASGVDIVVGTPGRIADLMDRDSLDISQTEIVALDEADEMMSQTFKDDVVDLLEQTKEGRQVLLFSATFPDSVKSLMKNYLHKPVTVDLLAEGRVPSKLKHFSMLVPSRDARLAVVAGLLRKHNPSRMIVFVNRKVEAAEAAEDLRKYGVQALPLHSDLSQQIREQYMQKFREGEVKVVVATDVAARGIDIPECEMVIQLDPPTNSFEFYIHRSGRTGRAGKEGTSIIMHGHSRQDRLFLRELQLAVDVQPLAPPTADDLVDSFVAHASKLLSEVHVDRTKPFMKLATELIEKENSLALAKALALITRYDPAAMQASLNAQNDDDEFFRELRKPRDRQERGGRRGDHSERFAPHQRDRSRFEGRQGGSAHGSGRSSHFGDRFESRRSDNYEDAPRRPPRRYQAPGDLSFGSRSDPLARYLDKNN